MRLSAAAELCPCFGLSMDRCSGIMRQSSTLVLHYALREGLGDICRLRRLDRWR